MEQPKLTNDPHYNNHQIHKQNNNELNTLITNWTQKLTTTELNEQLNEHNIVSKPIYSIEDIINDPHYQTQNIIYRFHNKELNKITIPKFIPKLNETHNEIT